MPGCRWIVAANRNIWQRNSQAICTAWSISIGWFTLMSPRRAFRTACLWEVQLEAGQERWEAAFNPTSNLNFLPARGLLRGRSFAGASHERAARASKRIVRLKEKKNLILLTADVCHSCVREIVLSIYFLFRAALGRISLSTLAVDRTFERSESSV